MHLLAGSGAGLTELVAGGWAESQAVVGAGRGAGSSPPLKVSTLRPCLWHLMRSAPPLSDQQGLGSL